MTQIDKRIMSLVKREKPTKCEHETWIFQGFAENFVEAYSIEVCVECGEERHCGDNTQRIKNSIIIERRVEYLKERGLI